MSEEQRSSSSAADPGATQAQSVLVADDDRLITAKLGQRLRRAGFKVIEVFDGPSVLATAASEKPDLAVLGHALPGMNGIEVARALAASSAVPMIFLSTCADEATVNEAICAGALTYVVKPIEPEQLLPIVRAALQRGREAHALLEQSERLRTALEREQTVSAAAGLLMATFGLGKREAFERLRQQARSRRAKLDDVAAELVRAYDETGRLMQQYAKSLPTEKPSEPESA